jgi:hypothetical protein
MMAPCTIDDCPRVTCARCKRQVDCVAQLARLGDGIEFVIGCHGQRKRLRFQVPALDADLALWRKRVLRDLNDAFKPPPQFRIRTRPRVRRAGMEAQ